MWKLDYSFRKHSAPINCVDVSPDMTYIATASTDGSIGVTNIQERKTTFLQGNMDPFFSCSISPNSQQIAGSSNSGQIYIWNASDGSKETVFRAHQQIVRTVCWSPDGKYIVTGSNDTTTAIWSLNRNTKRQTFTAMKGWVRDVKWQDNTIAVVGNDPNVYIFDPRQQKPVVTLVSDATADISSVTFHYSGTCVAAGSFDHNVRIWDLRTSSILQKHAAHTDGITRVAFNPYNEELLSVGRDGYARMWDLKSASITCTFQQHEGYVLSCAWLPSAQGFVTTGEDRKICVYRLEDKNIDPNSLELDDGDIFAAMEKLQKEINSLVATMKSIDRRLLLQEEKLQWLEDIDCKKMHTKKKN